MKPGIKALSIMLIFCFLFAPLSYGAEKVDLNKATEKELMNLPGIGPALAKRIIEYRDAHNGFKKVDELLNIKGIGKKRFDALKDIVTAGEKRGR